MTVRQMTTSRDTSASAYVHLREGALFWVDRYRAFWAVQVRDKIPSDAVLLTQDGWIYQDWQVLLPLDGSHVQAPVGNIKPRTDGVWRYEYKNETYPLLCRQIHWPELELLHTFR
jgi:hypothetical protein